MTSSPRGQCCALPDPKRHTGFPGPSLALPLRRTFTPAQYEALKLGLIPRDMDDRWFIYFNPRGKQLVFHRSWTSFCIFIVQLEEALDGSCCLTGAWANADPEQFRCADPEEAVRLLLPPLDRLLRAS